MTVYWVALLRYVGCTGHAHEVATVFGDEIAIRAQTLVHDAANPAEVMRDVVAFATAGRSPEEREQIVRMIQKTAHEWAVRNFSSGCEVADMLVQRLDFGPGVREALRFTFERWNGNGFPTHAQWRGDPAGHARCAPQPRYGGDRPHFSHRPRRSRPRANAATGLTTRRSPTCSLRMDPAGSISSDKIEPWDAVLDLEPEPRRMLDGEALDNALTLAADFIDLKSPYMAGHSRQCAQLSSDAARLLGLKEDAVATVRRAALVHDFGTTGVPNSIWDKPGPLTRAEFDRVELHPMLTEQMLRRSPALAALNPVACAHHEKCDGSGYHKRLRADTADAGACVLAATEIYVGHDHRAGRPCAVLARRRRHRTPPARLTRRA